MISDDFGTQNIDFSIKMSEGNFPSPSHSPSPLDASHSLGQRHRAPGAGTQRGNQMFDKNMCIR